MTVKIKKQTYYVHPYSVEDDGFKTLKDLNLSIKNDNFSNGDELYEVQIVRKLKIVSNYKLEEVK